MTQRTPAEQVRRLLKDHELNVTDGARALGVSRVTLSRFLNGGAALSGDMAVRVAKAFGVNFETLMAAQFKHDVEAARQRAATIDVRRVGGRS